MREGDRSEGDLCVNDIVQFFLIEAIWSANDKGHHILVLDDFSHVYGVTLASAFGKQHLESTVLFELFDEFSRLFRDDLLTGSVLFRLHIDDFQVPA